ncbi:hypothetical protein EB259_22570 [Salmonella enterica]|nr:hypothetical protein [Salmonella enterica]EBE4963887.1 hypothetical protein [Salmonella enterica]EBT5329114.1 hypothetical protein [Salmonella enterica]ECH4616704.1 hypothetical protein [Salmonella enterica]EGG9184119.1 hypothetical protein [Salmonella enterica]
MKKRCRQPENLRERCRHIFGDEPPVRHVWEPEFDYADAELQALAATDWRQITDWHLSVYYVLNLVYNEPMQPELFRYLFPLCLACWRETLLTNGYGDHFEESLLRALRRPYLWQEMMDAAQRQQVRAFLIDTMQARMDNERGFSSPLSWLDTFNALAGVAPLIRLLWNQWWSLDTPGKAVCALQYAAHLIYPVEVNPLWPQGWRQWQLPLGTKEPWSENNLAFLTRQLTPEIILVGVRKAAEILRDEPESAMATSIARDALVAQDIIAIQIEDLLLALSRGE